MNAQIHAQVPKLGAIDEVGRIIKPGHRCSLLLGSSNEGLQELVTHDFYFLGTEGAQGVAAVVVARKLGEGIGDHHPRTNIVYIVADFLGLKSLGNVRRVRISG